MRVRSSCGNCAYNWSSAVSWSFSSTRARTAGESRPKISCRDSEFRDCRRRKSRTLRSPESGGTACRLCSTPSILHGLPRRTAVDVHDERNFLARIRMARQNQIAIQHRAVIGFEFQMLRRNRGRNPLRCGLPRSSGTRRPARTPKCAAASASRNGFPQNVCRHRRNSRHSCPSSADMVCIPEPSSFTEKIFLLPRISFVGGKENCARCFVHAADRDDLIVSAFELAFEFGVGSRRVWPVETVEINVGVAVAPTGPQKAVAGFQDAKIVVDVDPRIRMPIRSAPCATCPDFASMK